MSLQSCLNCISHQSDNWDMYTGGCNRCPSGIIPSYLPEDQVIRYIKAYERKQNESNRNRRLS